LNIPSACCSLRLSRCCSRPYITMASRVDGFSRLGATGFFKQHKSKDGRTLFVVNVDPRVLRPTFSTFGTVERVDVDPFAPHKTRCARVTFESLRSVQSALAADLARVGEADDSSAESPTACQRLVLAHRAALPSTDALLQASNKCMAMFEKQECDDAARRAARREVGAEDDGFVTVTYKRKTRETPGTVNTLVASTKKKKKKTMELQNFYRHQIREEKKDQLAELRKRFEEDKARIAKLKETRKFKPL